MNNSIKTKNLNNIDEQTARELFKKVWVDHTYGIANSVCSLLEDNFLSSNAEEIGIITMKDLHLDEDNVYTFQNVIDACFKNGYSKITVPEIFNYLNAGLEYGSIPFYGPAVVLMDEVVDGEGQSGIIFIHSEENFLRGIGFFSPDNSKKLSKNAKFLVGKK